MLWSVKALLLWVSIGRFYWADLEGEETSVIGGDLYSNADYRARTEASDNNTVGIPEMIMSNFKSYVKSVFYVTEDRKKNLHSCKKVTKTQKHKKTHKNTNTFKK